jgi:glutaredoxin
MSYYHLYIKTDCGFCKKAIDLLIQKEKEFAITTLDHSATLEEYIKSAFSHGTVPIVLLSNTKEDAEDEFIGGYTELEESFDE